MPPTRIRSVVWSNVAPCCWAAEPQMCHETNNNLRTNRDHHTFGWSLGSSGLRAINLTGFFGVVVESVESTGTLESNPLRKAIFPATAADPNKSCQGSLSSGATQTCHIQAHVSWSRTEMVQTTLPQHPQMGVSENGVPWYTPYSRQMDP